MRRGREVHGDLHLAIFDARGVGFDRSRGIIETSAGFRIKRPMMQRAHDAAIFQTPSAERTTGVRADVVEGKKLSLQIVEREFATA